MTHSLRAEYHFELSLLRVERKFFFLFLVLAGRKFIDSNPKENKTVRLIDKFRSDLA